MRGTSESSERIPPPNELDEVLSRAWAMLRRGVADRRHGYHLPTLATVDTNGAPDARIVTLRKADEAQRVLLCHADIRAPKALQIAAGSRATWVFYDTGLKEQIRASGAAFLHHEDELADQRWSASKVMSRRCYLAPHAPGAATPGPDPNLPEDVRDARGFTAERASPGRANFAVIRCVVDRLDWLGLSGHGHTRAALSWDTSGAVTATWVAV
jgi:pyridoxamine 5'-phosphate oxidase